MDSPAPEDELALLDCNGVGAIIGRAPGTVLKLAAAGKIGSVKLGRRGIRFRPQDVAEYIERHRRPVKGEVA